MFKFKGFASQFALFAMHFMLLYGRNTSSCFGRLDIDDIMIAVRIDWHQEIVKHSKPDDPIQKIESKNKPLFKVALINASESTLIIPTTGSMIGHDQFQVILTLQNGETDVLKKSSQIAFTITIPTFYTIPPGSYQDFTIDIADGTWVIGEDEKFCDYKLVKELKVIYDPMGCKFRETRIEHGVFEYRVESSPVVMSELGSTDKKR